MLRTIIFAIAIATTIAVASPPDIATLSDLTIDEALSASFRNKSYGGVVILVDYQTNQSETWSRSAWNDIDFAEQLKAQGISVVYITEKSHPAIFAILNPRSYPAVYFWFNREFKAKRFGSSVKNTPERILEWIELARKNSSFSKEMIKQLDETPNDIALRLELIDELNRENDETEIHRHFCWLIEHNELWYQFAFESDDAESDEVGDTEMSFRSSLWWIIMAGRENLGLFKDMEPSFDNAPPRDGWEIALLFADQEENYVEYAEGLRIYLNLRRSLESKRDNNTATDRDLFVLKALTSEGEEVLALAEQFQSYFK